MIVKIIKKFLVILYRQITELIRILGDNNTAKKSTKMLFPITMWLVRTIKQNIYQGTIY